MRKVMVLLTTVLLLMITYFSADILEKYKFSRLLYQDRSAIVFNFNDYEGKPNDLITDLAKKYNTVISKYVFIDSKRIQVFSTDPTLGGRISLKTGDFPGKNTDNFISSNSTNNNLQTGKFNSVDSKMEINIFWLSNQTQSSTSGIYYIDSKDKELINEIATSVAQYGIATEIMEVNVQPVIEWPLITIISPLILLMSLLGVITFYYIHKTNEIVIMKIHGYTYLKIISSQLKDIFSTLIISSFISFILFILSELLFKNSLTQFPEVALMFLLLLIMLSIILICYVSILIKVILGLAKEYEAINGKKPYGLLLIISFLMKVSFLVLTLILSVQLHDTKVNLDNYQNNLSLWSKTEGLYKSTLLYTGQVDRRTENKQNKNLQKVYTELTKQQKGFVINTSNYEKISKGVLYNVNTEGKNPLTSPYGKAITISKNYLRYNPIQSETGKIEDFWIEDDTVLNLLVPVSLKKYEEEIRNNFLEQFHFQKIEVENIYNEEMNKPLNTTPKEDLRINIIYVKNGESYFTFDPSNKGEGDHYIYDPIAIIDNTQFDSSYYRSYISKFFYFYSNENDPMQTVGSITEKYNASSQVQSVKSVYDQYGDIIQKLVKSQYALLVAMIAISIAAITVSLYFTICYFHKNKLMLTIQYIHGHSFFKRSRRLLLLHLIILIPLILCALILDLGVMRFVIIAITVLDFIVILLLTNYLTNNAHVRVKKEI